MGTALDSFFGAADSNAQALPATSTTPPTAAVLDPSKPFGIEKLRSRASIPRFVLDRVLTPGAEEDALLNKTDPKLPDDAVPMSERRDLFELSGEVGSPAITVMNISVVDRRNEPSPNQTLIQFPVGSGDAPMVLIDVDPAAVSVRTTYTEGGEYIPLEAGSRIFDPIEVNDQRNLILTIDSSITAAQGFSWLLECELLPENGEQTRVVLSPSGSTYADVASVPPQDRFRLTAPTSSFERVYGPNSENMLAHLPDEHGVPGT